MNPLRVYGVRCVRCIYSSTLFHGFIFFFLYSPTCFVPFWSYLFDISMWCSHGNLEQSYMSTTNYTVCFCRVHKPNAQDFLMNVSAQFRNWPNEPSVRVCMDYLLYVFIHVWNWIDVEIRSLRNMPYLCARALCTVHTKINKWKLTNKLDEWMDGEKMRRNRSIKYT